MITLYKSLMDLCGLSQKQAADFHGVNLNTVKSWCAGRNNAPQGVIDELSGLFCYMSRAAHEVLNIAENAGASSLDLGYSADDAEAQSLGWPTASCHAAVMAMVAAEFDGSVTWSPRGSIVAALRDLGK